MIINNNRRKIKYRIMLTVHHRQFYYKMSPSEMKKRETKRELMNDVALNKHCKSSKIIWTLFHCYVIFMRWMCSLLMLIVYMHVSLYVSIFHRQFSFIWIDAGCWMLDVYGTCYANLWSIGAKSSCNFFCDSISSIFFLQIKQQKNVAFIIFSSYFFSLFTSDEE